MKLRLGHAVAPRVVAKDAADAGHVIHAEGIGGAKSGGDEGDPRAVAVQLFELLLQQIQAHGHGAVSGNRVEVLGANAQPAGDGAVAIVGRLGDQAGDFRTLQSALHGAGQDLFDADLRRHRGWRSFRPS